MKALAVEGSIVSGVASTTRCRVAPLWRVNAVVLQEAAGAGPTGDGLLTEGGDFLVTEGGDFIVTE